jgi:hypothetical protein
MLSSDHPLAGTLLGKSIDTKKLVVEKLLPSGQEVLSRKLPG